MRVPEGWTQTTVGKVLERVADPVAVDSSKTYQEIGIRSHGRGLFDKEPVSGAVLGEKRVFWIQPDCFILNIVFAWERAVGRTTVEDVGKIASHRFPMYRPKNGLVDVDYLLQFFKTERGRELLALASPGGAGRNKTLGQKEFLKLPLCLPPLREQRRIAEILSSVDEAIKATQAVFEQARTVKQGVLNSLLTKGIGHSHFKQTDIGEMPEVWKVVTVSDVLTDSRYGLNTPLLSEPLGVPVLRMGNIVDHALDFGDLKYAELSEADVEKYSIRRGDILFNRTNSRELVGKLAVANEDLDASFASYIIRLRTDRSQCDPWFLHLVLSSPAYQDHFRSIATPGASQANINAKKLGEVMVPLPPIAEQALIVAKLKAFGETILTSNTGKFSLQRINSALLSDLLTGRKRVSADALLPAE